MSESLEPTTAQVEEQTCACKQCGASLVYKPGTLTLFCEYCESFTEIEATVVEEIVELDFLSYAAQSEEQSSQTSKVMQCSQCGAESIFEEEIKSAPCPYCGIALVEGDMHEERLISPSYLQPFAVSQEDVQGHLKKWVNSLWFAPNKLKHQTAYSHELQGVYLPYWTYDAQTHTRYQGMRGDTYTVTTGTGKNRRTETRTRWSYRSGRVSRFFDDVLVPASRMIPAKILGKISNWNTKQLMETDARFYRGFTTTKYTVDLKQGYVTAKSIMDSQIDSDIRRDIGGSQQRILSKHTDYQDIRFKLILLPVYLSSYRYRHKLYHFYVNGHTGKITGDRPYSKLKIFFAVVATLIVLGLIFWYFYTEG